MRLACVKCDCDKFDGPRYLGYLLTQSGEYYDVTDDHEWLEYVCSGCGYKIRKRPHDHKGEKK